jgi:DNA polymerase-1
MVPYSLYGMGKPKVMVVGSYVSEGEAKYGGLNLPQEVLSILRELKITARYTTAIKCGVTQGSDIKVTHIKKCLPYLIKEIEEVKPEFVLLLGSQAVKGVLNQSVTAVNGNVIEKDGIKYISSFSPGILYQDPSKAPYVKKALDAFKAVVRGKTPELPQLNIRLLTTVGGVKKAIKNLGGGFVALDIETTGLSRHKDEITLIGFGNTERQYIIDVREKRRKSTVLAMIRGINANSFTVCETNGKFDNLFLYQDYHVIPKAGFDVMLASHALNENTPNGLKENAVIELGVPNWDIGVDQKKGFVSDEEYYQYLGYDVYFTAALSELFDERLRKDPQQYKIWKHVYMPVTRMYEMVEHRGVDIDQRQFREVEVKLLKELSVIEKKLRGYADINWNSPTQLAEVLYEKLGLSCPEKTKSGKPSTAEATLKQINHPIIKDILEFRRLSTQLHTFIDGWQGLMVDGKIYPSFKIHGTVTGRTSSSGPNLQQVPRDPTIRSLIVAPEGYSLVEADLSQAELRIAALMSKDGRMLEIYRNGEDIHAMTYVDIVGGKLSEDKYERKEQRKSAKACNFGFLYSMGAKKFKEYAKEKYDQNLTLKQAQAYRYKFFETYRKLPEWHEKQIRTVRRDGEVRSLIGRVRRLPDIYSSNSGKSAEAERQAINSPVQSFGSDFALLGACEIIGTSEYQNDQIDRERFWIIGTVHDAILFIVENDYVVEFIEKAKQILEHPHSLENDFKFFPEIPIVMDFSVGPAWSKGVELDMEGDWKSQVKEQLKKQLTK